MKNSLLKIYIFSFILLSDFMLFAQPTEDDNNDLQDDDAPPAPISGKLMWLAFIGILFAIYTYRKNRVKNI